MGQHRNQHSKADDNHAPGLKKRRRLGEPQDSGVVPSSMVHALRRLRHLDPWLPGEEPPWSIVEHYLTYGDDGTGVTEHARQDSAFAFVLESVRNQEEDARLDDLAPGDGPDSAPPDPSLDD